MKFLVLASLFAVLASQSSGANLNYCKAIMSSASYVKGASSLVSLFNGICGKGNSNSDTCGAADFDLQSALLCAFGVEKCKNINSVDKTNKLIKLTGMVVNYSTKAYPVLGEVLDNDIVCLVVEQACCKAKSSMATAALISNVLFEQDFTALSSKSDLAKDLYSGFKDDISKMDSSVTSAFSKYASSASNAVNSAVDKIKNLF